MIKFPFYLEHRPFKKKKIGTGTAVKVLKKRWRDGAVQCSAGQSSAAAAGDDG